MKIRGLWYDAPALDGYRGTVSSRGGKHKGEWVIRRDPRDRRSVFFQDPVTRSWHELPWTGMPAAGQAPAFGDARVRDLLRKADACGLRPKSDAELLPVLLEMIGARVPVSRWPTQMGKAERTGHSREAARAQAARFDRPADPAGGAGAGGRTGGATVTRLHREPGWVQRAEQARDSLDAERRRRREAAVPLTPKPPPHLGASFRERNVFVLPEDDEEPQR